MARQSWRGYAAILLRLQGKPATATEIASEFDMFPDNASEILRRMQTLKLIHVPCYAADIRGRLGVRQYAAGDGKSLKFMVRQLAPNTELVAFATMWRALDRDAHSDESLAATAGLCRGRVQPFLAWLHRKKAIHISDWENPRKNTNAGRLRPLYQLGAGKDLPRPPPLSDQAIWRESNRRKALKTDPAGHLRRLQESGSVFALASST